VSPDRPTPGLRAARAALGWSQSAAALELSALGHRRAVSIAAPPSLKSLLSRWENGHAQPEPHYRELLAELYGRTPAELGIADAGDPPEAGSAADRLRAAVAAAAVPDTASPGLWQAQLELATRLDDEFGVAGTGDLVPALVEQLDRRLVHALTPRDREAAATVLAGASALAAAQALDRAEHDTAWRYGDRARTAAVTARRPVAVAVALAGMAAVLVDAGEPAAAVTLLEHAPADGPPAAARIAAALGQAWAAQGRAASARAAFVTAFSEAEQALLGGLPPSGPTPAAPSRRIDLARSAGPVIELSDLHRAHGGALVALGDPAATGPLHQALDARPRSARHRAGLHADLAVTLSAEDPDAAADHAREARALAVRIGSRRLSARLAGPPIDGAVRR